MRLQSAIFDMDGTLLDSMPMWRSRGSTLVRSHGLTPPPDLDRRVNPLNLLAGAACCKELCGLPGTPEELAEEMLSQIGDFYRTQVRPKPGLERFLSLLKMEGVWMYVATATDRPLAEAALRTSRMPFTPSGPPTRPGSARRRSSTPRSLSRRSCAAWRTTTSCPMRRCLSRRAF